MSDCPKLASKYFCLSVGISRGRLRVEKQSWKTTGFPPPAASSVCVHTTLQVETYNTLADNTVGK